MDINNAEKYFTKFKKIHFVWAILCYSFICLYVKQKYPFKCKLFLIQTRNKAFSLFKIPTKFFFLVYYIKKHSRIHKRTVDTFYVLWNSVPHSKKIHFTYIFIASCINLTFERKNMHLIQCTLYVPHQKKMIAKTYRYIDVSYSLFEYISNFARHTPFMCEKANTKQNYKWKSHFKSFSWDFVTFFHTKNKNEKQPF